MSIFSLFNCQDKKIFIEDEIFVKKESQFKIDSKKADNIYESTFESNFSFIRDKNFVDDYQKVIYIQNNFYYIGYSSKLDKRGKLNPHLNYFAKISSKTGEISIIK